MRKLKIFVVTVSLALTGFVGASFTEDYVEAAGFVKLIRSEGEIDFVAALIAVQCQCTVFDITFFIEPDVASDTFVI